MQKSTIQTDTAPQAVGPYSQAVRSGDLLFISGQIPLDPKDQQMVSGGIVEQIEQVFQNLSAVCVAGGGSLDQLVKVNVYLTDLGHFGEVNKIMAKYCREPYPARAVVQVSALPKGAQVEIEAIMAL